MDAEQMKERMQVISNEMTQCRANYAKLEGHLAELVFWVEQEEKKLAEEMGENHGGTDDCNL